MKLADSDVMLMPDEIKKHLKPGDAFPQVMVMQGEVFRDVPGRKTIRVALGGGSYFIKQHFGVGWGEIFKNLLTLRWPIISARTEKNAIQKLDEIGIATTPLVAFAERGSNPAQQQSFLITRDLGDIISLEHLCGAWQQTPPEPRFKRKLIVAVAQLARKLHAHGMNHRDFYICHLCLDRACLDQQYLANNELRLYLIDLHRVGMRNALKSSDRMKDLAALYFSAMDCGLTMRDYLRFLRHYRMPHTGGLVLTPRFWQKVSARAEALYAKFQRKQAIKLAASRGKP
jgi:heptose I phosphotransferase